MELISIAWIGWIYAVISGCALLLGLAILGLQYGNAELRETARKRVLDDLVLFAIWVLGFAGGVGVLYGMGWSRPVLELFCWALMILLLMSCWTRLRETRSPWGMRTVSMVLFVTPIIAVCIATIVTLRSETALRVLAG